MEKRQTHLEEAIGSQAFYGAVRRLSGRRTLGSTWTSKIPKMMDQVLPILSRLQIPGHHFGHFGGPGMAPWLHRFLAPVPNGVHARTRGKPEVASEALQGMQLG